MKPSDLDAMQLFGSNDVFKTASKVRNNVFLTNEISRLTGFVSPVVDNRKSLARLNFQVGITAFDRENPSLEDFRENLRQGNFLCIPRTIPVAHSKDMLIIDGVVGDWPLQQMQAFTKQYTCSQRDALRLINSREDHLIEKFRRVFGEKFDQKIMIHLA